MTSTKHACALLFLFLSVVASTVRAEGGAEVFTKQYALRCTATSNKGGSNTCANNLCAASAAGAPDTNGCGPQFKTAWSPAATGAALQNLTCEFNTAVHATGVRIHETNAAPFVKEIRLTSISSGESYQVWAKTDATKCGQWLEASFKPTRYETTKVIITTASAGVEAIDAVELIGYAH